MLGRSQRTALLAACWVCILGADQVRSQIPCLDGADHCASNPCKNGGRCENHQDGFYCVCTPQYTDSNCGTRLRCPKDVTIIDSQSGDNLTWAETDPGMVASLQCPCGTLNTQLRVTRRCAVNSATGAQWEDPSIAACINNTIRSICSLSNASSEEKLNGLQNITEVTENLGESEVITSISLLETTTDAAAGNLTLSVSHFTIVDNILQVQTDILQNTQGSANTSSRLLAGLETVTNSLPIPEDSSDPVLITRRNFAVSVQRADPSTFVDLRFSASFGANFNFTMGNTLNSSDLIFDSAAQQQSTGSITLPSNLLSHLNQSSNSSRVSFMVFLMDSLFLRRRINSRLVGGIILAAGVVGERVEGLNPPVNMRFQRNLDIRGTDPECRFWNQTLDDGYGDWSSEGCVRLGNYSDNDTVVTCQCDHLTSFAILMDVSPTPPAVRNMTATDIALSAITYIGVSVSIICLLITITIYLLAKQLRSKDQGQLLLMLCFALLGLYIAFIVAGFVGGVAPLCVIFSGLIQYFMLVTFMTMLAEAINLYMKLVVVLGNLISNYVIKAYIVCWVFPLFLVLLTLPPGLQYYKHPRFCRPFNVPFYVGTVAPIAVIYIFNWIIYIIIISIIIKKSRKTDSNKEKRKQIRRQLISAMSLAVLFGLGWGVGFAATEGVPVPLRLPLSIIFIFLTAFQGLFIFLFQIVYSKAVREVWKKLFNKTSPRTRSKTISISGTSSETRFVALAKSEKRLSEQLIFYTKSGIEMKSLDIDLEKAPADL